MPELHRKNSSSCRGLKEQSTGFFQKSKHMILWYFKSMSNVEHQKKHMFMASLFLSKQHYFYIGVVCLTLQQICMELVIWFDGMFDSKLLLIRLANFTIVVLMLCLMVVQSLRKSHQLFKVSVAVAIIARMAIKLYEIVICQLHEKAEGYQIL